MSRVWQYIEAHHEDYGVALFLFPVMLAVFALLELACVVADFVS